MKKITFILMSLVISSLLFTVHASVGEFKINGTVTDGDGNLVDDAQVVIECNGFGHTVNTKDGLYKSGFSNAQCPEGSTITIDVTKGSMSGSTSATADSEDKSIDIVLAEVSEVPEFTTTTALIATLLSGGAYMLHKKGLLIANK